MLPTVIAEAINTIMGIFMLICLVGGFLWAIGSIFTGEAGERYTGAGTFDQQD